MLKLNRIELVKMLDEFHQEIKNIKPSDITNENYLKYLNLLKETLLSKEYEQDKRFVTYGRRDFLRQEMTDRLNQKVYTGINYKLEAFFDLEDYIRNNTWISLVSLANVDNPSEIIKQDGEYKKDGIICIEEKTILLEMINEFIEFLNTEI